MLGWLWKCLFRKGSRKEGRAYREAPKVEPREPSPPTAATIPSACRVPSEPTAEPLSYAALAFNKGYPSGPAEKTPPETAATALPAWLSGLPSRVAFLDIETTGIHGHDRIVSLAYITFNTDGLIGEKVDVRYTNLIFDPGKKCHPEASRVHGYDDWTLRHQPFFSEHAQEIRECLESADLLVAHNADFDLSFVNRELESAGLAPLSKPTFCTMRAYRSRFHGRASLNAVAAQMGMARSSVSHGALEDACLAMNIFLWLHGCTARLPISSFSKPEVSNFRPVPSMPDGELPPRKRRPRRNKALAAGSRSVPTVSIDGSYAAGASAHPGQPTS